MSLCYLYKESSDNNVLIGPDNVRRTHAKSICARPHPSILQGQFHDSKNHEQVRSIKGIAIVTAIGSNLAYRKDHVARGAILTRSLGDFIKLRRAKLGVSLFLWRKLQKKDEKEPWYSRVVKCESDKSYGGFLHHVVKKVCVGESFKVRLADIFR